MTTYKTLMRGVPEYSLQGAIETAEGTPFAIPITDQVIAIYIDGNDTPASGAVQIKVALTPADTLWANFGSAITVTAGRQVVNISAPIVFGAIRVDVSTIIGSGNVDALILVGPQ